MTLDQIIAILILENIVAFVIPLVTLLTLPVIWREEHLQNFGVLQSKTFQSSFSKQH
jgi:hypothetical protein